MSILIRAAAAYLVLLAAVVAGNFIVTPLYHPGGDEPFTVWEILNWFMAVGMVIALAGSYVEKRRVDGDGSADPEAIPGSERGFLRGSCCVHPVLLELV